MRCDRRGELGCRGLWVPGWDEGSVLALVVRSRLGREYETSLSGGTALQNRGVIYRPSFGLEGMSERRDLHTSGM